MKRTLPLLFCLLTLIFSSCKKSINCGVPCDYNEELVFNGGFEGVTIEQNGTKAHINGIDTAFTEKNNWDDWDKGDDVPFFNINYEDGDISQRKADLVDDPIHPGNTVLHYDIKSTNVFKRNDPLKSRIQVQMVDMQCIREYYHTVDIMFPSDMAQLKSYPDKIIWLSIFEFWNNGNWTGERFPFRITVSLHKEKEVEADLHYNVHAQTFKKPNNFTDVWNETATNFAIPFDQWMELELYVLEGDENNGRFYMAVTPEGGTKEVLFDINNTTQHPKEKCPDGFTHIQPLKWYTSHDLTQYMKDEGKSLEVYWDDWQLWKNKQP